MSDETGERNPEDVGPGDMGPGFVPPIPGDYIPPFLGMGPTPYSTYGVDMVTSYGDIREVGEQEAIDFGKKILQITLASARYNKLDSTGFGIPGTGRGKRKQEAVEMLNNHVPERTWLFFGFNKGIDNGFYEQQLEVAKLCMEANRTIADTKIATQFLTYGFKYKGLFRRTRSERVKNSSYELGEVGAQGIYNELISRTNIVPTDENILDVLKKARTTLEANAHVADRIKAGNESAAVFIFAEGKNDDTYYGEVKKEVERLEKMGVAVIGFYASSEGEEKMRACMQTDKSRVYHYDRRSDVVGSMEDEAKARGDAVYGLMNTTVNR